MIVWDALANQKEEHSSGRLSMLETKVKKLCVDLKGNELSKDV